MPTPNPGEINVRVRLAEHKWLDTVGVEMADGSLVTHDARGPEIRYLSGQWFEIFPVVPVSVPTSAARKQRRSCKS